MDENSRPWLELSRLLGGVEAVFREVSARHPDLVNCRPGCDDCCRAPFRVSLIEAALIRDSLDRLDDETRHRIIDRARAVAAQAVAIFTGLGGDPARDALAVARQRVDCPLLEEGRCLMYPVRPVTCRLYGLPTASGGESHTCPQSGFEPGQSYPTVDLDRLAAELDAISRHLALATGTDPDRLAPLTVAEAILLDLPPELRPPH